MSHKLQIFSALTAIWMVWAGASTLAVQSPPQFPSCVNQVPPGDHASYVYGYHAIPGGNSLIEGADDVYTLGNGNYWQCLCPISGTGIQTNWWNVASLTSQEISYYESLGWKYEWGLGWNLNDEPYLAKNSSFSCEQEGEPTPTPTATPTSQPAIGGVVQFSQVSADNVPAPVCTDTQLAAPTLLSVTKSGSDSVDLEWTAVTDAQYYTISYGIQPNIYIYGVPNTGNTTHFRVDSLDLSANRYYFQVGAVKGCMPGDPSNQVAYPPAIGGVPNLADTGSGRMMDLNILGAIVGLTLMAISGWRLRRYW